MNYDLPLDDGVPTTVSPSVDILSEEDSNDPIIITGDGEHDSEEATVLGDEPPQVTEEDERRAKEELEQAEELLKVS